MNHGLIEPECRATIDQASSLDALEALLGLEANALGFENYALVRTAGAVDRPARIGGIARYEDEVTSANLREHDPFAAGIRRLRRPFEWRELMELNDLTPGERDHLRVAANAGIARAWVTPLADDAYLLLADGLATNGVAFDRHNMTALATTAAATAERLAPLAPPRSGAIRLTPRQRECAVLAARGKSDWVAGKLLGLAPDTVHKYLEAAKRRYNVSSRAELIVRTLYDGQLRFADLID